MHFVQAPKGKVTHIATIRAHKTLPNVLSTLCGWNANKWQRHRKKKPVCKDCLADLKYLLRRLDLRIEEIEKND